MQACEVTCGMFNGEIMRRNTLLVTILATAALILSACGGGGNNNLLELTIEAVTATPEVEPAASTVNNNLDMNLCDTVEMDPSELTFAASYCLGNYCTGEDEKECNEIDAISGNDMTQFGQDGVPDCEWVNNGCEPSR
jgi:hypothetical protein